MLFIHIFVADASTRRDLRRQMGFTHSDYAKAQEYMALDEQREAEESVLEASVRARKSEADDGVMDGYTGKHGTRIAFGDPGPLDPR